MKKLILLVIITTARSIAFSQPSTTNNNTDTSNVIITKTIAREIIKDLLRKDLLLEENSILKSSNDLLIKNNTIKDSLLFLKDSYISNYRKQEEEYKKYIELQKSQIFEYQRIKESCDIVLKENKNQKRVIILQRTLGTIFLGSLTLLSILR
jgi:hypothetical protein